MKVLLVEDEKKIASFVRKGLEAQGFVVDVAHRGDEGFTLATTQPYDAAVLDIMLHEGPAGTDAMDGFEICRALRQTGFERPIVFLTARSGQADKLMGFELGGDDYVTKPFSLLELKARIEALLRRAPARSVFKFGDVEVDLDNYEIRRADGTIERLAHRERELLRFMIDNRGRILDRETLLARVWGYSANINTRTVDTHVLTVRKKLGDDANTPRFIQTLHGVGYQFIGREG